MMPTATKTVLMKTQATSAPARPVTHTLTPVEKRQSPGVTLMEVGPADRHADTFQALFWQGWVGWRADHR